MSDSIIQTVAYRQAKDNINDDATYSCCAAAMFRKMLLPNDDAIKRKDRRIDVPKIAKHSRSVVLCFEQHVLAL